MSDLDTLIGKVIESVYLSRDSQTIAFVFADSTFTTWHAEGD